MFCINWMSSKVNCLSLRNFKKLAQLMKLAFSVARAFSVLASWVYLHPRDLIRLIYGYKLRMCIDKLAMHINSWHSKFHGDTEVNNAFCHYVMIKLCSSISKYNCWMKICFLQQSTPHFMLSRLFPLET